MPMNLPVRTSVLKKPSISADAVDQRHRRLVAIARAIASPNPVRTSSRTV
jgi:hypothetical protein